MAEMLDDAIDVIEDDRFSAAERALSGAGKSLPNISIAAPRDPRKERKASSVSLPIYVWSELRKRSGMEEEPYNIMILKGLKEIGFNIDEDDLIDPRKLRHMKG